MKAKFKCEKCKFKWESEPGPIQCPKCGHIWVEWYNYEKWREWAEEQGYYG